MVGHRGRRGGSGFQGDRVGLKRRGWTLLCWAIIGLLPATSLWAQEPRVTADGQLPPDRRLEPLKDLDGYFPFEPPATLEAWKSRRAELRRELQVAVGLWPLPERTPLNAVIHGKIDQGDYTIEKVYFESLPGFFVTGNLYRPKGVQGAAPGILCPHGHWAEGRFYDCGPDEVQRQIDAGAESDPEAGRSPLQTRCVHLARMGAVVFHYDMIGYADSVQISYEVAHRFASQRPEMNTPERWGLFSPQAESHLQSVMGLQTYNSIRALDFLESLDDVDPDRLAVTGASGGGTQTFILAALDDRLKTAFPAVMVSTAMQGGCTCENCSLLRVGTGNVEIAALFAPKPMGMTAADDWTKEMTTKGFPQLQDLYALYDARDQVHLTSRTEFGHNYNQVGRAAMYRVFQPVLGLKADFEERPYERLTREQLTVWDDDHPSPPGGEEVERDILATWHRLSQAQLEAAVPRKPADWSTYRQWVGGGIDAILRRRLPAPNQARTTAWELVNKQQRDAYLEMSGWIRQTQAGEALPVVFLHPKTWNGQVVVWLTGEGKAGLYDQEGQLRDEIRRLVAQGISVLGADLLYQGEFLAEGKPLTETPRVANPREASGYTLGYNPSVAAQRAHDVITLVSYLREQDDYAVERLSLVGVGEAGPIVATAAAVVAPAVDALLADTRGFRYADVDDWRSPHLLPGGAKYFGLPGFVSLAGDTEVVLVGESAETIAWLDGIFQTDDGTGTIGLLRSESAPQAFADRLLNRR